MENKTPPSEWNVGNPLRSVRRMGETCGGGKITAEIFGQRMVVNGRGEGRLKKISKGAKD